MPVISLQNSASKGKRGGRHIPMQSDLREALQALKPENHKPVEPVIFSERGGLAQGMTAAGVCMWFHRLFETLGFSGASSHSGRRTFITRAAVNCVKAGGSLRDVQELAGHASLNMTQNYIVGTEDAKRKIIDMQ